ncbi:MAG: succinate dehydrogenase cytochrome b subunit [Deltaproteobacteria bacterium]|nr:succinate dehydrogenase cytochrome b subunit [Deltaproteobacteria bacterium]
MSVEAQKPPMFSALLNFLFKSSIGLKVVMAVTGVMMWGFVVGHMAGNLQALLPGPPGQWGKELNDYAHTLKTTLPLLWGTRIAMLGALVLHVFCGITLAMKNRAARPVGYGAPQAFAKSSIFGRIMPISGILLLAFIGMHLLHFTIPSFNKEAMMRSINGQPDVARMVADAFANPVFSGIYILGVVVVVGHLFHGSKSFLQTLGLQHNSWTPGLAMLGRVLVVMILIGNLAIPVILFSYGQQNPNWVHENRNGKVTATLKPMKKPSARNVPARKAKKRRKPTRVGKKRLPRRVLPAPKVVSPKEASKILKAAKAKKAKKANP